MKFPKTATAGVLFFGLGNVSSALPPCPDRPTPPPCCADGHGYSRSETFGVYETHWRPWPIQNLGPGKPQTGEQQLQNIVPRFESPSAEEEDRKAPPPTTPPEAPPSRIPTGTNNTTPGSETKTAPNAPGARQPGDTTEPAGQRRTLPPYEPQSPGGNRPTGGTGPTGEVDPPPALPFGPGSIQHGSPVREANRLPALPTRSERPFSGANSNPSDDPPPALPNTLAKLSN
jgi:hypothetical protein